MTNQLSIFDEIDAENEQIEIEKLKAIELQREKNMQPKQCSHCGEWSRNQYLSDTNHGIIFNGWCANRLHLNSWAKPGTWAEQHQEQFTTSTEWLSVRGWVACDEHDRANWVEGHIPYWEVQK